MKYVFSSSELGNLAFESLLMKHPELKTRKLVQRNDIWDFFTQRDTDDKIVLTLELLEEKPEGTT